MNKENLMRLIKRIESLQDWQYDQACLLHGGDGKAPCGTAACLLGHAYGVMQDYEIDQVIYEHYAPVIENDRHKVEWCDAINIMHDDVENWLMLYLRMPDHCLRNILMTSLLLLLVTHYAH